MNPLFRMTLKLKIVNKCTTKRKNSQIKLRTFRSFKFDYMSLCEGNFAMKVTLEISKNQFEHLENNDFLLKVTHDK